MTQNYLIRISKVKRKTVDTDGTYRRSAYTQSLYQLRYPSSEQNNLLDEMCG
jgi:hypothetical protein